ncbi:MAG: aminotransferase class V-fold PLP-dependent enzyme [Firmicutes bacterium]|nr:aminotransferase class V-fold PLP-dependent enzyme [Bacillota bacterium]
MIFLDNSSSSFFKPKSVFKAVENALLLPFNPSRASHLGAIKAGNLVYQTRKDLSATFGCSADRVLFCGSCTEALNLAIFGSAVVGGHVVTTVFEHNAVLRPLFRLKNAGIIDLTVVENEKDAERAVKENTYLLAINHVSNVTGQTADLNFYSDLAKKSGAALLVDAAQSAGYLDLNLEKMGIDMLALAPHKGLHSIMGVGALLLSKNAKIKPFKYGGTGSASSSVVQPEEIPEGFEAGTLPLPAIGTISEGLKWSMENKDRHGERLENFSAYLVDNLKKIGKIKVYSKPNRCGIVAFNIDEMASTDAGYIYDSQYDIALRCGFHCAPLVHKFFGTDECGMIRASIGVDTELDELDEFLAATKEIAY